MITRIKNIGKIITWDTTNDKIKNYKNQKLEILDRFCIDIVVIVEFTQELSLVSASDFFNQIIKSFNPTDVVMGHDNGFGHKRQGNVSFLKEKYDNEKFTLHTVKAKKDKNQINISSTTIRQSIKIGGIEKANIMLGRFYSIMGKVIKGQGIGRTIK